MNFEAIIRELFLLAFGAAICGFISTLPIPEPYRRPAIGIAGLSVLLGIAHDVGWI